MKISRFFAIGGLFAALAFGGCESIVPTAPPVTAAMSGSGQHADAATLTLGRSLFVSRCAHCHALPVASQHPAEKWPAIVAKMSKRAGLQPAEHDAVLSYILAAAHTP